jgi:hypothetical protein
MLQTINSLGTALFGIYIFLNLLGRANQSKNKSSINISFSLILICEFLNQLIKNHARPTNLSRIQNLNEKMVIT